MRRILFTALTLPLTLAVAAPSQAADNGFYLGGSIGRSSIETEEASLRFDGDDTAWKIIAGLRPLDWLGVEVNYVDFGNPDDTVAGLRAEAESTGISAFALGFLAVGPVDLFLKGGLVQWDTTLRSPSLPALSVDDDGTDFAYGAGLQFRVWSLSVRGEYEVFDIEDIDDTNLFSVGVTWTFL